MILIVDDHLDTCRVLVRLLRTEGIPAKCKDDPVAALAVIESMKPTLVVLDQMMPGLLGTDVLRAIRGMPLLAGLPAIFYSAAGGGGPDEAEARRLGALDWITKGRATWDELRDRILAAYRGGLAGPGGLSH